MIEDELAFPAVGGRVALDFVATLGKRDTARIERLRNPRDLERWARHAGVAAHVVDVDAAGLEGARDLREAVHRLVLVGLGRAEAAGDDLDLVNTCAAPDAPAGALALQGDRFRRDLPRTTVAGLLAAVARDTVDLLTGPEASAVRECAGEACTLLFVDTSRGGRRRWCSMDLCGARTKMRALRARQHS